MIFITCVCMHACIYFSLEILFLYEFARYDDDDYGDLFVSIGKIARKNNANACTTQPVVCPNLLASPEKTLCTTRRRSSSFFTLSSWTPLVFV